jgi:hypothetical protein
MIEDESHVDPRNVADTDHFEEAMQYDFAKFLTTLSLLVLGGMLTLSQTADKHIAKPPVIAFVAGAIAMAGVFAVSAASSLAKVGSFGTKQRTTPRTLINCSIALLGIGAGGFLFMWWKTL